MNEPGTTGGRKQNLAASKKKKKKKKKERKKRKENSGANMKRLTLTKKYTIKNNNCNELKLIKYIKMLEFIMILKKSFVPFDSF